MKTILITGGVRGIGRAIADLYVKKGYRTIVTYSKDEKNAKLAQEAGIEVYKADVSDYNAVKNIFKNIKNLDVLVNNAGISLIKQIQDTTEEEWDRIFNTNVKGAFLYSKEAIKLMLSNQRGLIVNVSSVWGEIGGSCESAYSATKSALLGFTKALAKEVGWSGIRVNSVSPGVIDTPMNSCFNKEEIDALKEDIPAGRLGTGEDIAKAIMFLEENEYINGVDIPINGGFSVV